jgi:hypothetical protein
MNKVKVYEIYHSEECLSFFLANENEQQQFDKLYESYWGQPLGDRWKTFHLRPSDYYSHFPMGDFPHFFADVLLFSTRAKVILQDMMAPSGEFLEMKYGNESVYAFNVTNFINVLDENKSEVKRFKSSGRIMSIEKYEFIPHLLENQVIFKIPQAKGRIFVTDKFVQRVNEHGLVGLEFVERWRNEK